MCSGHFDTYLQTNVSGTSSLLGLCALDFPYHCLFLYISLHLLPVPHITSSDTINVSILTPVLYLRLNLHPSINKYVIESQLIFSSGHHQTRQ